ncbi:CRISPR-associated protein Csx19 [Actinosynnema sp. NPDC059797]
MTLRVHTPLTPLTLRQALDAVAERNLVAFLSSATEHHIARCRDGEPATPDGPCPLDRVFAARLFDTGIDLRWHHDHDGLGQAALLTEHADAPPGWTSETIAVDSTLDGRYALWGRRFHLVEGHPDWTRAIEGRLGRLDLPHPPPAPTPTGQDWPTEYLCLTYREYLVTDAYGNLSVLDERLTGITTAAPADGKDR